MQPRIPRPTVVAAAIVALTLVTLTGLLAPALWYELVTRQDPFRLTFAAASIAAIFTLYARLLWLNLMRRTAPVHSLGLAALAALCWTLPAVLGGEPGWGNALMIPAGLVAVVLPLRHAVPVTAVATVLTPAYGLLLGLPALSVVYETIGFPITAFSGYVTVWLFHVVQELREARAELASSAVGQERLRFARDLHDVLGHSLQAVALRAEVADRFLDRDPERVRKELTEIQTMARAAVHDVREIARGHRKASLRSELAGMSAVLKAAGIDCESPDVPELPAHVHEPLGWVAREAATNILRHTHATYCTITLVTDTHVRLEIVNDGADRRSHTPGTGLHGLAERVAAASGEFTARPRGDGTFGVAASIPLGAP